VFPDPGSDLEHPTSRRVRNDPASPEVLEETGESLAALFLDRANLLEVAPDVGIVSGEMTVTPPGLRPKHGAL
jgi:hypothetical protein